MGWFVSAFTLQRDPTGGGDRMYARNEVTRFGRGEVRRNSLLDGTGLGSAFAQQYLAALGTVTGRQSLAAVYKDASQLAVNGRPATGVAAVLAELARLPEGVHEADTLDVQPLADGALLVVLQATGKRLPAVAHALVVAAAPSGGVAGPLPTVVTNHVLRFE
jgi:hypothetical protein